MFLLTFCAHPDTSHPEWGEVGGAYVNSWLPVDSFEQAEQIAIKEIASNNWIVESLDSWECLDRSDLVESESSLNLFDQAIREGMLFVYHTWPPDGDDDQTIQ